MGELMTDATSPLITPAFAPPTPRRVAHCRVAARTASNHDELDAVVDEMFTSEELAITNAVVVVQGGRVLAERYGGVRESSTARRADDE